MGISSKLSTNAFFTDGKTLLLAKNIVSAEVKKF